MDAKTFAELEDDKARTGYDLWLARRRLDMAWAIATVADRRYRRAAVASPYDFVTASIASDRATRAAWSLRGCDQFALEAAADYARACRAVDDAAEAEREARAVVLRKLDALVLRTGG